MSFSLQKRLNYLVRGVLDQYDGTWLLWCDPSGVWTPLLRRVADDSRMDGFTLLEITESTGDQAGSLGERRLLQERLDQGQSLVVVVHASGSALGWMWAQALRAEQIYDRSLRDQLLDWDWRPRDLTLSEAELGVLARQNLGQDPALWGTDSIQPDADLLLRLLTGMETPDDDNRLILERTIEVNGLPPLGRIDLALWRKKAVAALLVTQAHAVAPALIPDRHELLIAAGQREQALTLVDRWVDSLFLRARLPLMIAESDPIANLGPLITAAPANGKALAGYLRAAGAPERQPLGSGRTPVMPRAFLSLAAESAAFAAICGHFAAMRGALLIESLAAEAGAFRSRASSFWAESRPGFGAVPWAELARLAEAAALLVAHMPARAWAQPREAVDWYTAGGWRVDRAGEELLRTLTVARPELTALIQPLREAYRSRWESLAIRWSEVWRAAGFPLALLPTAGEWLKSALALSGPAAVILSDAFRFDQAAILAERLNAREKAARARVTGARAPLPSITALGMGQALPLTSDELEAAMVGGKWQLHQKGSDLNLSLAEDRRAWWQRAGVAAGNLLDLKQVVEQEIPAPTGAHAKLVIHDDAIDTLGHDDELEASGAGQVLDRYLMAIERLRQAGWRRILLSTDHGYMHWSGTAEQAAPAPEGTPVYSCRRALAFLANDLPDSFPAAPGGTYRVALAAGASTFKTYGGMGYYHGGGSLQEWVIPCFQAEWPASATLVEIAIRPVKAILSPRPKIVLEVSRASLLIEESLGRSVTVAIRNVATNERLFRAGEVLVTPDRDTVEIVLTRTAAVAPRGTVLRIEVCDALTDAVLASAESILMFEIDPWDSEPS